MQEDSLPAELPRKPRVCGIRTKDFNTFRIPKVIKQQQLENNNINIKNWEEGEEGEENIKEVSIFHCGKLITSKSDKSRKNCISILFNCVSGRNH